MQRSTSHELGAISADALRDVTGGKDAYLPALPAGDQALVNNGVAFMNANPAWGGGWSSGLAHHQGVKFGSLDRQTLYVNRGDKTGQVLMNPTTQQAIRRLQ